LGALEEGKTAKKQVKIEKLSQKPFARHGGEKKKRKDQNSILLSQGRKTKVSKKGIPGKQGLLDLGWLSHKRAAEKEDPSQEGKVKSPPVSRSAALGRAVQPSEKGGLQKGTGKVWKTLLATKSFGAEGRSGDKKKTASPEGKRIVKEPLLLAVENNRPYSIVGVEETGGGFSGRRSYQRGTCKDKRGGTLSLALFFWFEITRGKKRTLGGGGRNNVFKVVTCFGFQN